MEVKMQKTIRDKFRFVKSNLSDNSDVILTHIAIWDLRSYVVFLEKLILNATVYIRLRPIEELGLSKHVLKAIQDRFNVLDINDLVKISEKDLFKTLRFDARHCNEIENALKERGLMLGMSHKNKKKLKRDGNGEANYLFKNRRSLSEQGLQI